MSFGKYEEEIKKLVDRSVAKHQEEFEKLINKRFEEYITGLSLTDKDVDGKSYPPSYYPDNCDPIPYAMSAQKDEGSGCFFHSYHIGSIQDNKIKTLYFPSNTKPIVSKVYSLGSCPRYILNTFGETKYRGKGNKEVYCIERYMDPDEIEIIHYMYPVIFTDNHEKTRYEYERKVHKWFDRYRSYKILAKEVGKLVQKNKELVDENEALKNQIKDLESNYQLLLEGEKELENIKLLDYEKEYMCLEEEKLFLQGWSDILRKDEETLKERERAYRIQEDLQQQLIRKNAAAIVIQKAWRSTHKRREELEIVPNQNNSKWKIFASFVIPFYLLSLSLIFKYL